MSSQADAEDQDQPTAIAGQRRRAARHLAAEVLQQRERGEAVPDEQLLARHADLLPELAEELELVSRIRQAYLSARKVGPASAFAVLSNEELEAPITLPEDELSAVDQAQRSPRFTPSIRGYTGITEIGHGGQGTVYRATQESTGRVVAIKVMPGGALTGSRHRARFDREVKVLASLQHPNIVSVLDRGRADDGSFYLVMPYIEGQDLEAHWAALPPDRDGTQQLLELFVKLASAVEDAHRIKIVHRDLKPPNVLVDHRGEPHVLDFGLASAANTGLLARTMTQSGQLIGSLQWSSPEQAAGGAREIGPASDVYSLGVMLYQALTGRFPYAVGGELRHLLENIATVVPLPPSRLTESRPSSAALDAVVLRSLAKRPADRYATAGALATDLQDVLSGKPIPALRHRQKRRWRMLATTASAAILLAAAAVGLGSRMMHPAVPPVVFQLPAETNSLGMRFVRIAPAAFLMGSPINEAGRSSLEVNQQVTLKAPYFIGVTEVTQRQYQTVMGENPSDARWRGPDLPVTCVSWSKAGEFCQRLGERERRHYTLPTEAQWEYACRAGAGGPFGGSERLDEMGWYAGNSGGSIHPVAGKWANAFGLYDCHGNVREWCIASLATPQASAPHTPMCITKGGSALAPAAECRSAALRRLLPETFGSDIGFRVVLDPPAP